MGEYKKDGRIWNRASKKEKRPMPIEKNLPDSRSPPVGGYTNQKKQKELPEGMMWVYTLNGITKKFKFQMSSHLTISDRLLVYDVPYGTNVNHE